MPSSKFSLAARTSSVYLNALRLRDISAPQLLEGDANNDLLVTGGDLIAVQQNFGESEDPPVTGMLMGDANDDGLVTGADLISVQQNFGESLVAPVAVPEPMATLFLVVLGAGLRRRA